MTTGGPEIPKIGEPKRSGLRVFLYILLAVGGLGVLTCGGLLLLAARNPAVQQFVEAMAGSQSAPGTQQLRDAGCEIAQVFDLGSALALLSELDTGEMGEAEALMDMTMVQCLLPRSDSSGLGCDEVARIYSTAVPDPPDRFLVQVSPQFSSKAGCQVVYGADGAPIAPFDEYDPDPTARPMPGGSSGR
jgi:hypothetical protein